MILEPPPASCAWVSFYLTIGLLKTKTALFTGTWWFLRPGTQTMNWMHIHDVIDAIDHLITTQKAGTFDFVALKLF